MTTCKRIASYYRISHVDEDIDQMVDVICAQGDILDEVWIEAESPDLDKPVPSAFFRVVELVSARLFIPLVAVTDSTRLADSHLLLKFGASRVVGRYDRLLAADVDIRDWIEGCGLGRFSLHTYVDRMLDESEPAIRLTDQLGRVLEDDALHALTLLRNAGLSEVVVSSPPLHSVRTHPSQAIERMRNLLPIQIMSHATDRDMSDLIGPLLSGADGVVSTLIHDRAQTLEAKHTLGRYGLPARNHKVG